MLSRATAGQQLHQWVGCLGAEREAKGMGATQLGIWGFPPASSFALSLAREATLHHGYRPMAEGAWMRTSLEPVSVAPYSETGVHWFRPSPLWGCPCCQAPLVLWSKKPNPDIEFQLLCSIAVWRLSSCCVPSQRWPHFSGGSSHPQVQDHWDSCPGEAVVIFFDLCLPVAKAQPCHKPVPPGSATSSRP